VGGRTGEGAWKKIKEMPALIRDISKLNCITKMQIQCERVQALFLIFTVSCV
jgi:hypothetical protein